MRCHSARGSWCACARGPCVLPHLRQGGQAQGLRNFPEVRLCPATLRGTPTGERAVAQARLLCGDEDRAAARLLVGKYRLMHGVLVPLWHRMMRTATLHYELTGFRSAS